MPRAHDSAFRAAVCVVLVATLTACVSTVRGAGSISGSPLKAPGLAFGSCSGVDLGDTPPSSRFLVQCARLSVPLDYADPSGKHISIALVRLHRKDASPTASLLINPGGPGDSAIHWVVGSAASLPPRLTAHYDVVAFDPRGVGSSTPVRCLTDAQEDESIAADPDVLTSAGFTAAKRAAESVAHACAAKYGSSLDDFDTVATAKDMDRVRVALGQARTDYLGFSYGTELGAQYAHLFPSRVGAFVLDGAVDPLSDPITFDTEQTAAFEKAFDQFASWCRQRSPCDSLGDPREAVYRLVAQARKSPLHSSDPHETRVATSSVVLLGVLLALYSQALWPALGQSLQLAEQGDARGLLLLADEYTQRDRQGHYTNSLDANLTINCNDRAPGRPTDAQIRSTAAAWAKRYPMFGLWSAPSLFACQQWQPKRTVPAKPTAPDSANTILVVGNLHDPATPYQGAKDLAAVLGKARLLTWDGAGHTSYMEGSTCIDDAVTGYLVANTLPPIGTICPR